MKQSSVLRKRYEKSLGSRGILKTAAVGIKLFSEYFYYKMFKFNNFRLENKTLDYFYYPYNATWRNERCIEIPIVKNVLDKHKNKKILEIGNVLSYYYSINHEILDKYEKAEGVINEDIIKFNPITKYD